MNGKIWWGTSETIDDKSSLTPRLDMCFKDATVFANAQPFTLRVRGVMVQSEYDRNYLRPLKTNDLMVVTSSQFGAEPPVQRIHFMRDNVRLGWQGDFFNDTILALEAYNDEKRRLTLRLQVYDLDRMNADFVAAIAEMTKSVAIAFPTLANYAAAVSFSAEKLKELVNTLDNHDRIIDERITFQVAKEKTGHNLLQPGYFVCFAKPVEGDFQLDCNLQVQTESGAAYEGNYCVLGMERQFNAGREWEIDQKVAKLISELDGRGQSGKAAIEFLRETMDGYDRFKRMERVRVLTERKARLTKAERDFVEKVKSDPSLKPYLLNGIE